MSQLLKVLHGWCLKLVLYICFLEVIDVVSMYIEAWITFLNLYLHCCRKYGLEDDTIDFIGHALALYLNDSYLDQPATDFVKRMKVTLNSFFQQ